MAKTYEDGLRDGRAALTARLLDVLSELHETNSDKALAEWIGVLPESISQWRGGKVAPQRAKLKTICEHLASSFVEPLAEIEPVAPRLKSKTWHLHWDKKTREALKDRLTGRRGFYLFYDSRGHVTYVGQAKVDLFREIEARLKQKPRQSTYTSAPSGGRLKACHPPQGDVTRFISAYATVTEAAAHNLEAVLMRAVFNNLQNRKSGKIRLGDRAV